ncbi:MAG: hypothetical protein WC044_08245 [Crocinitomicaceae bacterium]
MDEKLYKNEDFYRHLAHLFYAFAAADRKIVIEEKRSIVASVEKNWTLHTDEFDAKEIIYSTMRKIIEGKLDKDLAFLSFEQFYTHHHEQFSYELKGKILTAADDITLAFAHRNKSELVLLARLGLLFAHA